ncbi:hypothetical protein [Enterocloster clostridioformis]|uniref:hypothetical protein n=1 Tax=Enterocloster clostridioformis TaxID=1531 RepID=UPI00321BDFCB
MATVDEILARQAYADGDETWTKDNNYPSYTLYVEPEYVPVTNKRIADFNDQISVRGEQNAQFVGFQLPRYDDGLDLTAQNLYIHYQTVYGGGDGVPCNVSKSDSHVRMCWKVPAQATQEPGTIQMMIYATGTNSAGERVTWKTLPASYTIHDGLDIGGGIPEPDQSWYEQFVAQMEGKVSTAQGYANDAQASKTAAAGSATASAQSATASAKALEDNKAYVESQKETFVGYNKRETGLRYANALIGQATDTTQVTMDDAWEAPIPGMEIAGKSEQVVTTGTQLFDESKLPSMSAGGATVTNNGDGSFTINGSGILTETYYKHYTYSREETLKILKPGKYNITYSPVYPRVCFLLTGTGVNKEIRSSSKIPKEITASDLAVENARLTISFYGALNETITPGTLKPMVWAKETLPTDADWEPYTGGRPSPSPEYPQEIVSTDVTAVTVTGANLFDTSALVTSGGASWTVSSDKREITVTGSKAYAFVRSDIPVQLIDGKTVTISCSISNGNPDVTVSVQIEFTQPDGKTKYLSISSSGSNKISITQDIVKARFKLYANNSGKVLDTPNTVTYSDVMLNIGETALPWEPYAGYQTAAITLAEPLRGIGDVRDRIMCRDGVWGVERAINQIDDTGMVPISEALEALDTPTWEPLPSDTQTALNTLTTYKGRTTITVTAEGPEPDVAVEYVQDTRMVIADLQAQIDAIRNGGTI